MLEKERQVWIMDQIRTEGFVSVKDLMTELNASRSSIMRDLIALEKQGLLVREHGGAVLPGVNETLSRRSEPDVSDKVNVNVEAKRKISAKAAEMIRPGSCIFLDSGTTVPFLLHAVSQTDVNIVTPSVYLVNHLPKKQKGNVYLLGGVFDEKYEMNRGEYTAAMLGMFHIDMGFFSANGINLKTGEVMVADFDLAVSKQRAMRQCGRSFLLVDSSKLKQQAECTYAHLSDFEAVFINGRKKAGYPKNIVNVED